MSIRCAFSTQMQSQAIEIVLEAGVEGCEILPLHHIVNDEACKVEVHQRDADGPVDFARLSLVESEAQ